MSEAISDLASQAGSTTRCRVRTQQASPSQIPHPVAKNYHERYDLTAHDPRYGHFARIPARIVRCLDYFQVQCDRLAAEEILGAYYIFIGVVDNAIDSGAPETAILVFDLLESPASNQMGDSDVVLVTQNLSRYVNHEIKPIVTNKLRELHQAVLEERLATSVELYIEKRTAVGRLTADLSYALIRPLLSGEEIILRAFMQRVGAVGCLVDSVIDLSADQRRELVGFTPTIRDYIKLVLAALFEGLAIGWKHPRLIYLFAHAILDIARDRFIAKSDSMNGEKPVPGER
jgi:hypothetical protein